MQMVRDRRPLHVVEEQPDAPSWEELGVGPKEVAGWEAIGFGRRQGVDVETARARCSGQRRGTEEDDVGD